MSEEQSQTDGPIKLLLYGATGSIGESTLSVISAHRQRFDLVAVSAHSNTNALDRIVRNYRPRIAIVSDSALAQAAQAAATRWRNDGITTELVLGAVALEEVAAGEDYDTLLAAISGAAGLPSTLAAARRGKRIALANKESLVMAGPVLKTMIHESGGELLPVDSEHSGVWQCLQGWENENVARVTLTASGGPFRTLSMSQMKSVSVEQALKHPTWEMGRKISIDSATLMNKALELIEARWLFDMERDRLDAIVHPQSIVHAFVEYADGSTLAQLGVADMRTPIQLALLWPERTNCPAPRLNLEELSELEFEPVDHERFPSIRLGFDVCEIGGTAGAVLNAANEIAVAAFMSKRIGFLKIAETCDAALQAHDLKSKPQLSDILEADTWARSFARRRVDSLR